METNIFLAILTILFIVLVIVHMGWNNKKYSGCSFILGWLSMMVFTIVFFPEKKHITIESSSDSEWIRSEKDYPDTVITNVKVLEHEGKIDTVYPTIVYKRIEL